MKLTWTPRRMTTRHNPPHSHGDCWRTCLAMALGLEVREVPHFGDPRQFRESLNREAEREWLRARGWVRTHFPVWGGDGWDWVVEVLDQQPRTAVIVITGKSPRGEWNHDAVWRDGQLYDPFTGGAGAFDGPALDRIVADAPWYWMNVLTPTVEDPDARTD